MITGTKIANFFANSPFVRVGRYKIAGNREKFLHFAVVFPDQVYIVLSGLYPCPAAVALFQIIGFCLVVLTPTSGVVLAFRRVFVVFPAAVLSSAGL